MPNNNQLPLWETPLWSIKYDHDHDQIWLDLEDTSISHYRAVAQPHLRACRGIIATYNWLAYNLEHGDLSDLRD